MSKVYLARISRNNAKAMLKNIKLILKKQCNIDYKQKLSLSGKNDTR